MADKNIKKTIISQSQLPSIDRNLQGYSVRYRVISEDKNRTSHWSPISLIQPEYNFVTGQSSIHKANANLVIVAWDPVTINRIINGTTYFIKKAAEYDVWIRWGKNNDGDWIYDGRAQSSSVNLVIPTTYYINDVDQEQAPNRLTVEVYLKGEPISRSLEYLKVYTSGPHTI